MPHSSQAPLISDRQDRERDDRRHDDDEELLRRDDYYDDGDADADADADQHTLPPPIKTTGVQASLFIWLLTFAAGISGLLFGCTLLCLPLVEMCFVRANYLAKTTRASSQQLSSPSTAPSRTASSHPSTNPSSRQARPYSPLSSPLSPPS